MPGLTLVAFTFVTSLWPLRWWLFACFFTDEKTETQRIKSCVKGHTAVGSVVEPTASKSQVPCFSGIGRGGGGREDRADGQRTISSKGRY